MAVGDINRITARVLEDILAMPTATGARYTAAIGSNSEYKVLQEIKDTVLAIDLDICGNFIDIAESGSGAGFMFPTGSLVSGSLIPSHEGARGNVELLDGSTWRDGLLASSEDEIAEMLASPTLYANAGLFYFIKFRMIRHNASAARLFLPTLSKTSACQAHERWENATVWGTNTALEKDGGNSEFFRKYERLYMGEQAKIRALGSLVVTEEMPDARERAA